ncbi:MAG TPA: Rrf2 family transcriptional regulator [Thermodesulfovibrionales bacterium]|nr:Rrf2 family transcriptional regulator [Thermodesulfovibrionales bacterium]
MHITRETDYAVRCVLYLSGVSDGVSVVDDIAGEMGIPKSFLAKILQKLAKAGIVTSIRGVKGGFRLAQKPERINLLKVIEATQGQLSLNLCVLDEKSCSRSSTCSIHPVWVRIQDIMEKELKRQSFKGFLRESVSRETNVPKRPSSKD